MLLKYNNKIAPVVQRIGREFPKLEIQVRFLVGAQTHAKPGDRGTSLKSATKNR